VNVNTTYLLYQPIFHTTLAVTDCICHTGL